MTLTRVVLVCREEGEYTKVKDAAHCGALEGTEVVLDGTCRGAYVLECAPFTAGVVGADTVIVVSHNPAFTPDTPTSPPPPPTHPTPATLRVSPFCRLQGPLLSLSVKRSNTETHPTSAVISETTAITHQLMHGKVALLSVDDTITSGVTIHVDSSATHDGMLVSPECYDNLFRASLGFPQVATEGEKVCSVSEVLPKAGLPVADWVELRPVSVPYEALMEASPVLFDAALGSFFGSSQMLSLGALLSLGLPKGEDALPALAMLDFDAFTEGNLHGGSPQVHLVVAKASKDGVLLDDTPFVFEKGTTELVLLTAPTVRGVAPREVATFCTKLGVFREVSTFISQILSVGSRYHGTLLLRGEEGGAAEVVHSGGIDAVAAAAEHLGCHLLERSATVVDKNDVESLIRIAGRAPPTILLIRDVEALFGATEAPGTASNSPDDAPAPTTAGYFLTRLLSALDEAEHPIIIVCAANLSGKLPSDFAAFFQKTVTVSAPTATERAAFFSSEVASQVQVSRAVSPASFAKLTAGLSLLGLRQVALSAVKACASRASHLPKAPEGVTLLIETRDFSEAAATYGKAHQLNVSTDVQKVSWKDIGGLKDAKEEILECIHLPLSQPEMFKESGMKPRTGILMYGPPGCGKTLLAKGVATECGLNFISVKGPEMLNMYVGESERNIRELFAKARQAAPCVVFFDELDALVPNRGAKGDSGGVMDRIVAQLLTEVDTLGGNVDEFVFIIGATNRPDLIDQSLLRPGRFDRCVYLGVASSSAEQATILKAQTRKMNLSPDVDLTALANTMPKTYSGADLYALSTEALMLAMREKVDSLVDSVEQKREEIERNEGEAEGDSSEEEGDPENAAKGKPKEEESALAAIVVTQAHLLEAKQSAAPSITVGDLARYQAMKEQFDTAL